MGAYRLHAGTNNEAVFSYALRRLMIDAFRRRSTASRNAGRSMAMVCRMRERLASLSALYSAPGSECQGLLDNLSAIQWVQSLYSYHANWVAQDVFQVLVQADQSQ